MRRTRQTHRTWIGLLVGAAALALTFSGPAHAAGHQGSPKPTVVLVHGAWADSSSWSGVVSRLQDDGYPVVVVANPLRGLATDSAYLAGYLATIPGPIVLVGHSYGGAVVTNAATGDPDVKALVYVDAFAPDEGESVVQLAAAKPGSALACRRPEHRLLVRAVPRRGSRRRRAHRAAEGLPHGVRQRPAATSGRRAGRHPASGRPVRAE